MLARVVTPLVPRGPLAWGATVVFAALLLHAVAGDGGLLDSRRLRAERRALEEALFDRLGENDRLRREIRVLAGSDRALERLVRKKSSLVRDGEIVYRFPPSARGPESRVAGR